MAIASHGGHDRHGRRAFLVDSVRLVLNRHELGIHLMIHPMIQVARDERGRVRAVAEDDGQIEAWTLVEIDAARSRHVSGDRERTRIGPRRRRPGGQRLVGDGASGLALADELEHCDSGDPRITAGDPGGGGVPPVAGR